MPKTPTELTPMQLAEVETLAAVLSSKQMADYFGIGRTTFYGILARDDEVAERYKRGRARAVGAVAQSLIAKARAGNVTAMIFFLKTQAGWREVDRHEHVTAPGITVVDSYSDAELVRIIDGAAGDGDDRSSGARKLAQMLDTIAERQQATQWVDET